MRKTLSKIYQKIKSVFRAVFKISGWIKKIARWVFKLRPSLKRKVFMAGAAYFYNRFIEEKDRVKNKKSGIKNKN